MKVKDKLRDMVKKYDNWCESMGLTQEQGRCCVPVRKEDYSDKKKSETREESDSGTV
ncbi:DUF5363 domain-containing protein [Vibrio sp. JC009]|uniref:DUF5363 family protein n=1 Tax=Vibrio sp. JC009 TaxID=2912314 RepID=UPI0023AF3FAA|nr:DUF5363 family protein [Vibrio sp. JC009]WED21218.1 DUF5363 domain-containing protein [Vibrio sp. JC009]